jgi:RHS repeat-associated protein
VLGRRVLEDRTDNSGNHTTTRFAYDGNQVWAELNTSNGVQARYLYGDGETQVLERTDGSGNVQWFLTDRLGNVRDIATSTVVSNHVEYQAFGAIASESTPGVGEAKLYTGLYLDRATGIVFADKRTLLVTTGQWMQEDPIWFQAGDANLRRYVGNNPTNRLDPSGLEETPPISISMNQPSATFGNITVKAVGKVNGPPRLPIVYYYRGNGKWIIIGEFDESTQQVLFNPNGTLLGIPLSRIVKRANTGVFWTDPTGRWDSDDWKKFFESKGKQASLPDLDPSNHANMWKKEFGTDRLGVMKQLLRNGIDSAEAIYVGGPTELAVIATLGAIVVVYKTAAEANTMAAAWKQGQATRPILDRQTGKQIGEITADGNRVIRYPHTDKKTPDLHWNLEDKKSGDNIHVIIK